MNNKQRLLLLIAFGTVILWGLCACTGDASVPHDEPPEPADVRVFKQYQLGYTRVNSYVVETADGQKVTCFITINDAGTVRGFSCIPHLK